jgi:hypothetical protein
MRENAVAIEKKAVERPSLPARSSRSGGVNGVDGVGGGIVMKVDVSIEAASYRRPVRSVSRPSSPRSVIALFSFAARTPPGF